MNVDKIKTNIRKKMKFLQIDKVKLPLSVCDSVCEMFDKKIRRDLNTRRYKNIIWHDKLENVSFYAYDESHHNGDYYNEIDGEVFDLPPEFFDILLGVVNDHIIENVKKELIKKKEHEAKEKEQNEINEYLKQYELEITF